MKYFIGIDIGGTNIKACVLSQKGELISRASFQTPVDVVKSGVHYRDMNIMWNKAAEAVKTAINKSGIEPGLIVAVGCTGHGKGLYLWGKDNAPCCPAIPSTDSRAEYIVDRWKASGVTAAASALNLQNTLACQPSALLAWMKENQPQVYNNIKWIFEAKDFIRFMLTDVPMMEYTDTSGTGLLNLHTRDYDKELLNIYGIPEIADCLPPLCNSYDSCGTVTANASRLTGLPQGIPVCGGMFDIDACAVAMGITDPSQLCAITGTWSINEYISKTPIISSQGEALVNHSLFCIPGYYLMEESSPTSAGNLDWVVENMLGIKDPDYKKIDEEVDSISPDTGDPVLFFPFLYGTNSSIIRNAEFRGLHSGHTRGDILRAVFEGVAFSHKQHIDRLLAHRPAPDAIRIGGGAANSKVWMQMFADVLNIPVQVAVCKELGASGAAMAAAISCGFYGNYNEAAQNMLELGDTFYPRIDMHNAYMTKYKAYKEAVQ